MKFWLDLRTEFLNFCLDSYYRNRGKSSAMIHHRFENKFSYIKYASYLLKTTSSSRSVYCVEKSITGNALESQNIFQKVSSILMSDISSGISQKQIFILQKLIDEKAKKVIFGAKSVQKNYSKR